MKEKSKEIHKEVKSATKRNQKVILLLVIFAVLLVGALPAYVTFINIADTLAEKKISYEFHQEVQQYPAIKVKRFMLWEGDSMADLEIVGKGPASIWYGLDKVPRITAIENFNTSSFDCFYIDKKRNKEGYAYTQYLTLHGDTQWEKWFPFQVNTLHDLITRYDQIVKILKTFPQNPPLVEFNDLSGKREVRQVSDPKFVLNTPFGNKPTVCDLYFLTH